VGGQSLCDLGGRRGRLVVNLAPESKSLDSLKGFGATPVATNGLGRGILASDAGASVTGEASNL
jgi:hypothetical protein